MFVFYTFVRRINCRVQSLYDPSTCYNNPNTSTYNPRRYPNRTSTMGHSHPLNYYLVYVPLAMTFNFISVRSGNSDTMPISIAPGAVDFDQTGPEEDIVKIEKNAGPSGMCMREKTAERRLKGSAIHGVP